MHIFSPSKQAKNDDVQEGHWSDLRDCFNTSGWQVKKTLEYGCKILTRADDISFPLQKWKVLTGTSCCNIRWFIDFKESLGD